MLAEVSACSCDSSWRCIRRSAASDDADDADDAAGAFLLASVVPFGLAFLAAAFLVGEDFFAAGFFSAGCSSEARCAGVSTAGFSVVAVIRIRPRVR
ncbi:hypothetical protein ASG49_10685 [Marmoricola sp. Leaf446]|nr:hypothetical protein ASG49_10685 [Marmoricola sp. Leaf446]